MNTHTTSMAVDTRPIVDLDSAYVWACEFERSDEDDREWGAYSVQLFATRAEAVRYAEQIVIDESQSFDDPVYWVEQHEQDGPMPDWSSTWTLDAGECQIAIRVAVARFGTTYIATM